MDYRRVARATIASALLISAFLGAFLSLSPSRRLLAAEPSSTPQPFAAVAIAGFDDLSTALGQVAAQLGYEEQFKPMLEFATGIDAVKKLNSAEPIAFFVACDGNSIAPFLRVPLANEPSEDDLASFRKGCDFINEKISDKTTKTINCAYSNGALYFTIDEFLPIAVKTPYDPKTLFREAPDGAAKIVTFNVNLTKLPKELIEAGTALLRQKISELASDADEDELADIEQTLEYYYGLFDSLGKVEWTLYVDQEGNIHTASTVTHKAKSYVAENLEKSSAEQTRWSKLAETPDAIAYSVAAGIFSDQAKTYNANHFKYTIKKNLSKPLDALKDDEVNYAFAQKLTNLFSEILEADLQADSYDFGVAALTTPAAIFCSTTTKPNAVKEALKVAADRLKSEFPQEFEQYVKLDAEKVAGYDISKFDASDFEGDLAQLNDYLNGKTLSIRFAVSDSAVVFAFGLGEEELDAVLRNVLEDSLHRAPQPNRSVFDLSKLAALIANETIALREAKAEDPDARAFFEVVDLVANAENAVLTTTQEVNKNVIKTDSVFPAEIVKLIGEAIPIIADRNIEDSGQDLDDIFDE